MSRSSSDSTSRGPDDTWSGKRTADDDEGSNLSEPQKRLRRDGSSPRSEDEQVQDFIVVSSQQQSGNIDSQREGDARTAPPSQQSSCFSSPLSSAPSRLTEDCAEIAQNPTEALQNNFSPKNSDSNRQELQPGPANTADEERTVLPPMSPGVPSGGGLWFGTSGQSSERHYRTPLPTQKEPREDASPPRDDHSPGRGDDLGRNAQYSTTRSMDQPSNAFTVSANEHSNNSNASDPQSVGHADDYTRTVPKEAQQLSVRSGSVWNARVESRQLPPLPPMSAQFPAIGREPMPRPHDNQSPGPGHNIKGLEGGLNTFPSNFSVLTSEEIQRNQASGARGGRRRGKKPPGPTGVHGGGIERPSPSAILSNVSQGDSQPEHFQLRHDSGLEEGQPTRSPQFGDATIGSRPVSTVNPMPLVYHTVHPRRSATPPPARNGPYASFLPPPVTFTVDNRAESTLQTLDVQPYIESFIQNTVIILPSDRDTGTHPISVVMWQGLADFYKWYAQIARVQEIGPLMFELIDIHWQDEKSFVVPEGSLNYFRTIKQYIWDLYWLAVHINKGSSSFKILITPFTPRGEGSPARRDGQWNPVNSSISDLPGGHEVQPQNPIILESRPGPLYPHQRHLSGLASSLPTTMSMNRPMVSPRQNHVSSPVGQPAEQQSRPRHGSFGLAQPVNQETQQNRRPQSLPSDSPQIQHARTIREQAMLRERAHAYLAERRDHELLALESTVLDKLPYKTGAEVCGVVIDKRSGKGLVAVTGKGYITLNVKTGPDEPGDRYQDVPIQTKQTCMLHGEAVVLFYRRKQQRPESAAQQLPRAENQIRRPSTGSDVDIVIRLQVDGSGRFSSAFDKSVLRPKISTTEFFSFFANQSGHCAPQGPPCLKFTFKDAMPEPSSTEIVKGNEDHFNYMRKDIKTQCEKAKQYMVDLKEFVILVTAPGWTAPNADEEEW